MRVAVLTGQFPKLSETFILDQIVGLLNRGHHVSVYSLTEAETPMQPEVIQYRLLDRCQYAVHPPYSRVRRVTNSALSVVRLAAASPLNTSAIVQMAWPLDSPAQQRVRLACLLSRGQFDVLHCHFGQNGRLALEIRMALGRDFPIITSFHGADLDTEALQGGYQSLFLSGSRFIANTEYTKGTLEAIGCPADRIAVVPVGVNATGLEAQERILEAGAPLRLLTVARLVAFKGLKYAIDAVKELTCRGMKVEYRIIGDGPLRNELQSQVERLGLMKEVTFLGAMDRPNVLREMANSHAFILPSILHGGRTETQGLVLQEAQATGLPVIATNVGGIPEGLIDGQTGFLVPPENSAALAERILWFARTSSEWATIGRAARTFVTSKYGNSELTRKLESLYMEAIPRTEVQGAKELC